MATEEEHKMISEIVEQILNNNVVEVKNLLAKTNLNANCCDDHGMSLLQHASYKGNLEMVQLLLDRGAGVNGGNHEYQYTALHFAALSGKTEVCQLLLNYGAKVSVTNSVGRTPTQMAAFVGNHDCVAVINNFISKDEVTYYTKPTGQEKEAKLSPILAEPLHKFITKVNLNPVKVALTLRSLAPLMEHLEEIRKVLELMSEKEMKRGMESNEIMALKLHYLQSIVKEIARLKRNLNAQDEKKTTEVVPDEEGGKRGDAVDVFIRKMLRVNRSGETVDQNQLLVDIVRSFHARDSATFRQMVTTLARADAPNPLTVIIDAINGQRAFADPDSECWACGERKASKKCSKCRDVRYCDRECQRIHWFVHKKMCNRVNSNSNAGPDGPKVTQETVKSALDAVQTLSVS